MIRPLRLAVRFTAASKVKTTLLVLLVAVGMTVFLIVTELSRVSSDGLDDAIAEDTGRPGSYRVTLQSDLGMPLPALSAAVISAVRPFTDLPVQIVQVLPALKSECPPYAELGAPQFLVLYDEQLRPARLPFGTNLPVDTQFCFGGQQVPADAAYVPTKAQQRDLGSGLFIDARYAGVVALSTTGPVQYTFTVVTGSKVDRTQDLTQAVSTALAEPAQRSGLPPDSGSASVRRLDDGDSVRAASDGIRLVYTVIGWGVLLLGGLGLLVAEMIVVRDRTWFFGLARAVGARGRHIVLMIFMDVLAVLLAGAALALAACAALQPTARDFAMDAFSIRTDLLNPSSVGRLVVGSALLLLLAATYPAVTALRQDPLDVLENRQG